MRTTITLLVILALLNIADADPFTSSFVVPANFQNSTALSVAVGLGESVFASNGKNLSTAPFDGSPSVPIPLGFTSSHVTVHSMRFSPDGILHLLIFQSTSPPPGTSPAGVRRSDGSGGFPLLVEFGPSRTLARSMAFDPTGGFIVVGNVGNNGWLRTYDAAGILTADVDLALRPAVVAFDSSGVPYLATRDGRIMRVTNSGLVFVAEVPGALFIDAFAIHSSGAFFVSAGFPGNGDTSHSLVRLHPSGEVDLFASNVRAQDLFFASPNVLYIADHNLDAIQGDSKGRSRVHRVTGDFAGEWASSPAVGLPEPSALLLVVVGVAAAMVKRRRRRA